MNRRTRITVSLLMLGLLMLSVTPALAHTRAGTLALQGTVSFSSSNGELYNDENRTQLTLSPVAHYFVINQFAVGGRLGVDLVDQGNFNSTSFFVGPSAAYYFSVDNQTIPYVGAGVFFRSITTKSRNAQGQTIETDLGGTSISLQVGLAHFLREHLAVTPELSINLESLEGESGTTFLLGAGLAGFLY